MVAAYMMSTCNGGCEYSSLYCLTSTSLPVLSLSQRSISVRCSTRSTRTPGHLVMMTLIYASATPSHIPSLVHVTHARDRNGFRTIPIAVLSPNPCAYVSDLSWTDYSANCTQVMDAMESVSCCYKESIAFDMITGPVGSPTLSLPK
jgi:hypothetical protein